MIPQCLGGSVAVLIMACVCAGAAPISHVIHMSIDGLGGYHIGSYLSNAPAQFPNFQRLRTEGAFTFNARCDFSASETIPNHACMFTGRPVHQPAGFPDTVHHGYDNNFPATNHTFHTHGNPNVPYKASVFDVVHDHGLTTAFFAGKERLRICERSYNDVYGAPDLIGDDNGRDKLDVVLIGDTQIAAEIDAALGYLTSATPPTYTFIHLREPDITGHSLNWGSAAYSNMVRQVDAQLGRVLGAIDTNPALLDQTAIVLTSDHGGGGVLPYGHSEPHHVLNYTIPFFIWGPGIPAGRNAYSLFSNRRGPGTNRLDYTVRPQPLRTGDSGNIALALLGLPAIPGSMLIPSFQMPELFVVREAGGFKLVWNDPDHAFVLERTDSLVVPAQWETLTTGVTDEDGARVYRFSATDPMRFFRLRKN